MQNVSYQIQTKVHWNQSPNRNLKIHQDPNITRVPLHTLKPILFLPKYLITKHAPIKPQEPTFLVSKQIKKLLDHFVDTPLVSMHNPQLRKETVPHESCKLIAQSRWSRSSSSFWQRIQQKWPTKKGNILKSQSIELTRPNKTSQVKNLNFFGINPLQDIKDIHANVRRIRKVTKERFARRNL